MLIEPELALAVILARGIAAVVIHMWRVACRNDLIQSADPEDLRNVVNGRASFKSGQGTMLDFFCNLRLASYLAVRSPIRASLR